MTRCRAAAVLAGTLAAYAASSAAAVGASDAAVTSFVVQSAERVQEVELVAGHEDDGDVLLLRVEECRRHSCVTDERVLRLGAGELVLTERTAALDVTLSGRHLRVTWNLGGDGFQLSGPRFRGEGLGGHATAGTFAGRSASVQVQLDGEQCATTGALGTGVRFDTNAAAAAIALGAGGLTCAED